jgi:Tfp pilus assembly protein PilF
MAQAELYYRDSLAISRPLQMNWHAANSYVGLAQSLLYQGKIAEASEPLQDSFRLAQEINAPDVTVEAYCTLAEIQLAKGELELAGESAQAAVKLASQIEVGPFLATAWRLISVCSLRQSDAQSAGQALETAWKALEEGPDQLEEGRLHAQARLVAAAMNDFEHAQRHQVAAEQIFEELGAARDMSLLTSLSAKPDQGVNSA